MPVLPTRALPTRRIAVGVGALIFGAAAPVHAHGPMGLQGLGQGVMLVVGVVALGLSAVLGAGAWAMVFQSPKSVGGVFGRGFLGVSAVLAFLIGGMGFAMGLDLWFPLAMPVGFGTVAVLTLAFLAVEFLIAATLYRRVHAQRPSGLAQALSVLSTIVGGALSLVAALVAVYLVVDAVSPADVRPSAEVRRYQEGCAVDRGSDCNMLGLRYQTGEPGLPRDPAQAAAAFAKACELSTPIGCRNLAKLHRSGDGVPKDAMLAAEYERRDEALRAANPP